MDSRECILEFFRQLALEALDEPRIGCLDRASKLVKKIQSSFPDSYVSIVQISPVNRECLRPLVLPNISWEDHHYIAIWENEVWDPLLAEPVKCEDYIDMMFGNAETRVVRLM